MNSDKQMNLIIAINESYIPMCKAMLFSFVTNHKDNKINVFLLNSSIKKGKLKELDAFARSLGIKLSIVEVQPETMLHSLKAQSRFSIEMYYRIFAHKLLPEDVKRALWIDSDIIVLKNISDFYFQSFDDKPIVVCRDFAYDSAEIASIKKKLSIAPEHDYFNSGVILFNFDIIRREFSETEFEKIVDEYGSSLKYPDQDLLNMIYQNRVKYANEITYNYQVNNTVRADAENLNIRILHYAGYKKPWSPKIANPICRYYWKNQWKMKNYSEFFKFYLIYCIYVPKKLLRRIVKGN